MILISPNVIQARMSYGVADKQTYRCMMDLVDVSTMVGENFEMYTSKMAGNAFN